MNGEALLSYRFGDYLLSPHEHSLTRAGQELPLRLKSFEVLLHLVRNHNHVVTRDELLEAVWPETHITETVLSHSIWEIRQAFSDQGEQSELIRTVPKVGYQFVAEVVEIQVQTDESRSTRRHVRNQAGDAKLGRWLRIGMVTAVFVAAVLLLGPGAILDHAPEEQAENGISSIAVLPFRNLSPDPEQGWFADALTDSLITQLGKISPVRVISVQSTLRFRKVETPLLEIAQQLEVDALVEGGALLTDEKVQITAQLLQVRPEKHLWAEKYDRGDEDLIEVLDEMAVTIAAEVGVAVKPGNELRLARFRNTNPDAYKSYLKGRHLYMKLTIESVEKAVEYFRAAVEKDPSFALAYAALADCYLGFEDLQAADAAIEKALQIDDELAEAHVSLGIRRRHEFDFQGAEEAFRHAVDLNPNCARGWAFLANSKASRGKANEGIDHARRAQELDPLNKQVNMGLCAIYYAARQYDEALREVLSFRDLHSEFSGTYVLLGMIYEQKQMYKEAIASYKKAPTLGPAPEAKPYMARAQALNGTIGEARKTLDELLKEEPVQPCFVAAVYIGMGEKNLAIEWLERAYDERHYPIIGINADPAWDPLRGDSRFQALIRRLGLEPQEPLN